MSTPICAILLGVWLFVQPWLVWPQLLPDTSHRLTLVALASGMGLACLCRVRQAIPLPVRWAGWMACLLGVMVVHQWDVMTTGEYFRFFTETVVLSDGVLVVLALAWGLWGLRQLPARWFPLLRWAGLAMLVLNAGFMVAQAGGRRWHLGSFMPGHLTGVMGLDRALGAYGVAWLPIMLVWQPWASLLCLGLVACSGKFAAWIGAGVAVCLTKPSWAWGAVPVSLLGACRFGGASFWLSVHQRLDTWWTALRASVVHPWVGWGFSPMAVPTMQQQYGYALPSLHSDWLLLVICGGWPLAILTGWLAWQIMRTPSKTAWRRATRASLLAIAFMSAIQTVASHARIAGLMLVMLAWWWMETDQQTKERA